MSERLEQYHELKKKGLSGVYLNLHSVSLKVGMSSGKSWDPSIPEQYMGSGWINGAGEGNCPNSPPRGEDPREIHGDGR